MKDIFNRPNPPISNESSIGRDEPVTTGWKCLDRARRRTSISVPGNMMEDSFNSALASADGVELFSLEKESFAKPYRGIVKNLKDNWRQDIKDIALEKNVDVQVGSVIQWDRYGIKWLIVSQDLIYKDYFRGEMYRANFKIKWKNKHGETISQWAAIRGPVETKNKNEQTTGNTIIGKGNDTLEVMISANEDYPYIDDLKRYGKFYLGGKNWKILVIDSISSHGIYRISCIEDYINEDTDDMVEELPNGEVDFGKTEGSTEIRIVGPQKIKTKVSTTYYVIDKNDNLVNGKFIVSASENAIVEDDGKGTAKIIGVKIGLKIDIRFEADSGEISEIKGVRTVSPMA